MGLKPAFANKPAGGATSPAFASDGSDLVFARFAALVRGSTELHGCTVLAWDRPSADQSPPGDDGPPWVRLTPSPGDAEPMCRTETGIAYKMPVVVEIETSVPGTEVVQSQRLWGAVLRALFPGGMLDAQLESLGVSQYRIVRPSWGTPRASTSAKEDAAGESRRCEGAGRFEMVLYYDSRM